MPAEHVNVCIAGVVKICMTFASVVELANGQPDVSYGRKPLAGQCSKIKVTQGMGSGHVL